MIIDGSNCDVAMDWAHHLAHQGRLFGLSLSKSLSAAGTFMVHIQTPSAKKVHFDARVTSNLSGVLVFRRGDTIGATGDAKSAVNYNENSKESYSSTFKQDGTVDPAGTVLKTIVIGSNGPGTKIGGEGRTGTEYILLPSTIYTLLFTADSNSTVVAMNIDFYEV